MFYREIHINYLHSESSQLLWDFSTNSDAVAAGQWFNYNLTQKPDSQNTISCQRVVSSPLLQRGNIVDKLHSSTQTGSDWLQQAGNLSAFINYIKVY